MNSPGEALVWFWTTWCGACRVAIPSVIRLASEEPEDLAVGLVDIDDMLELSMELGLRELPVYVFFKNGKIVDRYQGTFTYDELSEWLNSRQSRGIAR